MPRPRRDPLAVRDRALRTARRTARACAAGGLGLATALSFLAAHTPSGHTQSDGRPARATTPAAPARPRVPPPQPVPQIDGAPPAPQPPPQAPTPDVAPAPAPVAPPAVSGGS
jgi:hypothetical protein